MNVQNAKSLEIEEGDVKTIHDKDGKLLWGAVGYDTKYAGDTFQQTYTGKNLFGIDTADILASNCSYVENNGVYTLTATGDSPSLRIKLLKPISQGTVAMSGDKAKASGTTISLRGSSGNYIGANVAASQLPQSATITADAYYVTFFSAITSGQTLDIDLSNFQIEEGSTPTTYEPYVGGTASPNPDYPQDVQTVTGTQTVTISDGNNQSEDFTVRLGSLELCKIGTYQDYIYKSGDDWYVRKETGSGTLTGTTADMSVSQQSGTGRFNIVLPTSWSVYKHQANSILAFCNSYQLVGQSEYNSGFDNAVANMSYALNFNSGGGNALRIKNIDATTVQEMKDSMTATPLVLYFQLATPTDTKITNADLISDLEAVHEWMTRYGYQASVTGNLPMIIRQDALT